MPEDQHALKIDTISLSTFKSTLARYSEHIPESLAELDVFRSKTLPERLREQREEQLADSASNTNETTANTEKKVKKKAKRGLSGLAWSGGGPPTARKGRGPHLTKDELVKLVEWKLYVQVFFEHFWSGDDREGCVEKRSSEGDQLA
jgi:hypothetical protein